MDSTQLVDADATLAQLQTVRVAVVPLGEMSPHIFGLYFGILSSIDSVQLSDVAGLHMTRPSEKSKYQYHLDVKSAQVRLQFVRSKEHSVWRNLVASKRVMGIVALIHARRNSDEDLRRLFQSFRAMQAETPLARCILVDPDDSQSGMDLSSIGLRDTDFDHIRFVPWVSRENASRVLLSMVHELVLGIVQDILGTMRREGELPLTTHLDRELQHETKQKWAERMQARMLKHLGDLCLLLGDTKSAQQSFRQACDASERIGDLLWCAASIEGDACAIYSENCRSGEGKWVGEVTSLLEEALRDYDKVHCPELRVECGVRLAYFLSIYTTDRKKILDMIMDTSSHATTRLQGQIPLLRRLAQIALSIGCQRKAASMLRLAALYEHKAGRDFQSWRTYLPAARLLKIPIGFDEGRGVLTVLDEKSCAGGGWDTLQLLLVKEMLQVAAKLRQDGRDMGLHCQLSLFVLSHFARLTNQSWQQATLQELKQAAPSVHGLLDASPLPLLTGSGVVPAHLPVHLRPIVQTNHVGKRVFVTNPYLKRKEEVPVTWVRGRTGQVSITLTNIFKVPLEFTTVSVRVKDDLLHRVIACCDETLPALGRSTVTVGVVPLSVGNLTITGVEVSLAALPHHPPFVLQLAESVTVPVAMDLPELSVCPKGLSVHRVAVHCLTGSRSHLTTLVLYNTGQTSIPCIELRLAEELVAPPRGIVITYDRDALERALPLEAGSTLEVPIELWTPPSLPQQHRGNAVRVTPAPASGGASTVHLPLQMRVVYGKGTDHRELVATERMRNIDGHWETYVLSRCEQPLPVTVALTEGPRLAAPCKMSVCRRFIVVRVYNRSSGCVLVNAEYTCTEVRENDTQRMHPFFLPLLPPTSMGELAAGVPPTLGPAPAEVQLPVRDTVTVLLPLSQWSFPVCFSRGDSALGLLLPRLSLRWRSDVEAGREAGAIPLAPEPQPPGALVGQLSRCRMMHVGDLEAEINTLRSRTGKRGQPAPEPAPAEEEPPQLTCTGGCGVAVQLSVCAEDGSGEEQLCVSHTTFCQRPAGVLVEPRRLYQMRVSLLRLVRDGAEAGGCADSEEFSSTITLAQPASRAGFMHGCGLDGLLAVEGDTVCNNLTEDPSLQLRWTASQSSQPPAYTFARTQVEAAAEPTGVSAHEVVVVVMQPGPYVVQVNLEDARGGAYLHSFSVLCSAAE
eukprot:TRINITY_DN30006_c0_g1_i1.p1 TRINITY_DN30006_c0_g1~~TRINITY_DN30006_c0_g1_i1.p1  ORF type:complete len:1189 (+),score=284.38 TRINITY_DN30006_c0_g1_i1:120-3686(+)